MENTNITFFDTFTAAFDHIETEVYMDEKHGLRCDMELCYPLGYLLFPHVHLDIMQRIKLAKYSRNIQEFMKVFDIDNMETLANYFGIPIEDLRCMLENETIFSKMKKILTCIMVCNQAMKCRLYRYNAYDELSIFLHRTREFYQDCEKILRIEDVL